MAHLAFKATDINGRCRGFQFEVGGRYSIKEQIKACHIGFHSCDNLIDVFKYYPNNILQTRIFQVENIGLVIKDDDKNVTNDIRFLNELSIAEVKHILISSGSSSGSGSGDGPGYGSGSDDGSADGSGSGSGDGPGSGDGSGSGSGSGPGYGSGYGSGSGSGSGDGDGSLRFEDQ